MLRSGTLWAGVAMIVLGAVAVVGAMNVPPSGALSDPLGPRAFPLGLGVGAMALGVVLALRARFGAYADVTDTGRMRTVAVVTGGVALYVALLMPLGYLLTTFCFFGLLFRYLGERRWWLCAAVSAPVTAALYGGFVFGLGVALPTGPFGF